MRYSSRRRKLFCYYCNNKSDLTFDGLIPQWMCKKCDAVNYLDENGDIKDPPIAIKSPLPLPVRYAIPSSQASTALSKNPSIFCELCLKNQHLYTSSLAQYHFDADNDDPHHSNFDIGYSKFQKELEKRYPQVCEKCKPAALRRIKEAGKTAKADYLRRLMDKTRENRSKPNNNSLFTLDNLGKIFWNLGLAGQLVCNILPLSITSLHLFSANLETSYFIFLPGFTQSLITPTIPKTWAFRVVICTLTSVWWCPKLKESNKSLKKIFSDFKKWYYCQLIQASLRVALFYVLYNSSFSTYSVSFVTFWAHIVMVVLTVFINFKAFNSLRVDRTQLWDPKLENINLSPQLEASKKGQESMEDILDEIVSTTNRVQYSNSRADLDARSTPAQGSSAFSQKYVDNDSRQSLIYNSPLPQSSLQTGSSIHNFGLQDRLNQNLSPINSNFKHQYHQNQSSPVKSTLRLPARTAPSLLEMSEEEATRYLKTGELPSNQQSEEMDWQSTQSHYRAFHPRPKTPIKKLNQTPTSDVSSPFWFKIPPAPITPAQRLRNPPNRPSLQVPSSQNKQNLFHGMISGRSNDSVLVNESKSPQRKSSGIFELSQPKFFPPEPSSESEIMLADLLTGINLNNSEDNNRGFFYFDKLYQVIPNLAVAALIPIIIVSVYSFFKFV